jgi:MFS superfamily sulfate permease-like transporter
MLRVLVKKIILLYYKIFFAIFHVGFVTKYLSDVIVAAFTTGAAYHIVVSQLPLLLGLKVKPPEIPTKIIGVCIFIIFTFDFNLF